MKKYFIILSIICLFSCSFYKAPEITIYNDSSEPIKNITLLGSGFSKNIPLLESSKSISITVQSVGESALEMQFDTPKGRIIKDDLAYVESRGGYKVTIKIDEDFNVDSTSKLVAY
jgi:hypothetical protein